jgi:hypothetical protein
MAGSGTNSSARLGPSVAGSLIGRFASAAAFILDSFDVMADARSQPAMSQTIKKISHHP